ncbi:TRAP transporter large permease subunit [Chloroflexota bacterium]
MKPTLLLNDGIRRLTTAVGWAAGIILSMMMVFVTVDVFLRYVFNRPFRSSPDIIQVLLIVVVFGAVAYTALQDNHVSVDLVTRRFSRKAQAVLEACVYFLSLGLLVVMSWEAVVHGQYFQQINETSSGLYIPLGPFLYIVAFGCALFSIVLIVKLADSVGGLMEGGRQTWLWLLLGGVVVLSILTSPLWLQQVPWKMSGGAVGAIGIGFLILFIFLKVPVGIVMAVVGVICMSYLLNLEAGLGLLKIWPYTTAYSYTMSVIPLFILMGYFCFHSGLSRDLYQAVYSWLGRLRGGLAMATIGACAAFAAVTGSIVATAATMSAVALPEMKRYKYDPSLATGCIAAGGTIGGLIPPSIILVLYGIMAEQSIGKLFIAGIIPGVLEALFYMITIYILCRRNPLLGPPGSPTTFREKLASFKASSGVIALFVLVMGGMYMGVFTPTEAGAVGAFGAFVFLVGKKALTRRNFTASILDTGSTTGMVFLILIGAMMLGSFLGITKLPLALAGLAGSLEVNRYIILGIIILVHIGLGCIMDSLALIVLTVPIIFPTILALGFHPIWFGIILCRVAEIGAITPPVGITAFVIAGMAKDVPLSTVFRGIIPFFLADICHLALLIAIPAIVTFLPGLMA